MMSVTHSKLRVLNSQTLSTRLLFSRRLSTPSVYPEFENFGKVYLFKNARSALFHATKLISSKRESKIILMPSYGCGSELEPVLKAGGKVKFYRVDKRMKVDIRDLKNNIDGSIAAIHVTHYNGFPQAIHEIRDLCNQKGLYLIEDCAHVLRSVCDGQFRLGSFGDLAVFSMRKTTPIPDGGALVVNNASFQFDDAHLVSMDILKTLRMVQYLLKRNWAVESPLLYAGITKTTEWSRIILSRMGGVNRSSENAEYKPLEVNDTSVYSFGRFDQRISWVAKKLLGRIKFAEVIERRRENYQYLLEELGEIGWIKPVFSEIPQGTCPLDFLCIVPDPVNVKRQLLSYGIESDPYWDFFHPAVPWKDFPEAAYLKTHVLALPIHQDIGEREREYLVASMRRIKGT
jgi:dTDP-4-amino-4,6-dideoxygalactose transaminase